MRKCGPSKTREYWPHRSVRGQQGCIQEFKCRGGSTAQESTCICPKSSQPGWRNVTAIQEHPARTTTPQPSTQHQAKSSSNSEAPRASGVCSDILPVFYLLFLWSSSFQSENSCPIPVANITYVWTIGSFICFYGSENFASRWVICKSSTLSNLCDTEMSLWTLIFRVCNLGELQGRITTRFLRTILGQMKSWSPVSVSRWGVWK